MQKGGTYLLLLRLEKGAQVAVGRLGRFLFTAGYYVYIGSALGGLEARLACHYGPVKRRHWHIDYLRAIARLEEERGVASEERLECRWARAVAQLPGAGCPVRGFGSSDCSCPAHLVHFSQRPNLEPFGELQPRPESRP